MSRRDQLLTPENDWDLTPWAIEVVVASALILIPFGALAMILWVVGGLR